MPGAQIRSFGHGIGDLGPITARSTARTAATARSAASATARSAIGAAMATERSTSTAAQRRHEATNRAASRCTERRMQIRSMPRRRALRPGTERAPNTTLLAGGCRMPTAQAPLPSWAVANKQSNQVSANVGRTRTDLLRERSIEQHFSWAAPSLSSYMPPRKLPTGRLPVNWPSR